MARLLKEKNRQIYIKFNSKINKWIIYYNCANPMFDFIQFVYLPNFLEYPIALKLFAIRTPIPHSKIRMIVV